MEEVVLGLLSLSNKTIYELKQVFEKELSLAYSASLGCLEIVLKKLLIKNEISSFEQEEKGILKKYYRLEKSGKIRLQKWLNEPIKSPQFKDASLAKIYFLPSIQTTVRIEMLKEQITKVKQEYDKLFVQKEEQISDGSRWLLEYRMQLLQMNLRWYKKILKYQKMKEKSL